MDNNPRHDTAQAAPAFPGDTGLLPIDTRVALCKLLQGPYLDESSGSWPALLRDEAWIRRYLSELFLELVLDRDRLVAFVRQAELGELEAPVLLRSRPLPFIDSALVLHLREKLLEAERNAERAVVEEQELIDQMEIYALAAGGDRVGAHKRIGAAIKRLREDKILRQRGAEGRLEVSPALRLLFGPDEVEALEARYRELAAAGGDDEADVAGDAEDGNDH